MDNNLNVPNSNEKVWNDLYLIAVTKTVERDISLLVPTINAPSQGVQSQQLSLTYPPKSEQENILLYTWHLKADTLTDSAYFLGLIKLPRVLIIIIVPAWAGNFLSLHVGETLPPSTC